MRPATTATTATALRGLRSNTMPVTAATSPAARVTNPSEPSRPLAVTLAPDPDTSAQGRNDPTASSAPPTIATTPAVRVTRPPIWLIPCSFRSARHRSISGHHASSHELGVPLDNYL